MKYNDKLRLFFKEKGYSQKKVAEITGVSATMIGRYFSGKDNFPPDFLSVLLKKFPEIDLKYIFGENREEMMMVGEPPSDYGYNAENIMEELELIEEKILKIKNYLTQNCHTK